MGEDIPKVYDVFRAASILKSSLSCPFIKVLGHSVEWEKMFKIHTVLS